MTRLVRILTSQILHQVNPCEKWHLAVCPMNHTHTLFVANYSNNHFGSSTHTHTHTHSKYSCPLLIRNSKKEINLTDEHYSKLVH